MKDNSKRRHEGRHYSMEVRSFDVSREDGRRRTRRLDHDINGCVDVNEGVPDGRSASEKTSAYVPF
jgi:hypothetical protein